MAIDKEPGDIHPRAAKFLLYLPEKESQELTLLFLHYLLRIRNQKVVYLGMGISLNDLRDACQPFQPDYVFTLLQEPLGRQSVQAYVDKAAQIVSSGQVMLSGTQVFVNELKLPKNARLLNGLPDTLQLLDKLVQQQQESGSDE